MSRLFWIAVFITVVAIPAQAQRVTLQEYDELCPEIDFSPRNPVCLSVDVRVICEDEEGIDFSPRPPVVCTRMICEVVDFSPRREECRDG